MNKRHFEMIAGIIQTIQTSDGDLNPADERAEIARVFADAFEREFPLFKRDRFLAACKSGANVRSTKVRS